MKGIESPVQIERIQQAILLIRGKRVMLDADLAKLYGVSTKRLNEQVKRNRDRFPQDFMFQLNPEEAEVLRSQNATSKEGRGGRRYLPFAFTEHGAIMLASVLNTPRAIEVSVFVIRAFARLREILATHRSLANKLAELEGKIETHDEAIRSLVSAIRQLMAAPEEPPKKIGFHIRGKRAFYGHKQFLASALRTQFSALFLDAESHSLSKAVSASLCSGLSTQDSGLFHSARPIGRESSICWGKCQDVKPDPDTPQKRLPGI